MDKTDNIMSMKEYQQTQGPYFSTPTKTLRKLAAVDPAAAKALQARLLYAQQLWK